MLANHRLHHSQTNKISTEAAKDPRIVVTHVNRHVWMKLALVSSLKFLF